MRLGRKQIILLVLSFILAVGGIFILNYLEEIDEIDIAKVIVLKKDLVPHEIITKENTKVISMIKENIPKNVLKDLDSALGQKVLVLKREGAFLYKEDLVGIQKYPENTISINIEKHEDFLLGNLEENKEYMVIFFKEGSYHNTIKTKFLYATDQALTKISNTKDKLMPIKFIYLQFDSFDEAMEFSINIDNYSTKLLNVSSEILENYEYEPIILETLQKESVDSDREDFDKDAKNSENETLDSSEIEGNVDEKVK